jgi:hypothetical protein
MTLHLVKFDILHNVTAHFRGKKGAWIHIRAQGPKPKLMQLLVTALGQPLEVRRREKEICALLKIQGILCRVKYLYFYFGNFTVSKHKPRSHFFNEDFYLSLSFTDLPK